MKCGDGSIGGATIERAMLGTHRRGGVSRCCVLVLRAPECVRRGHEMRVPDARAHRASLGGRGDGWISRRRLLGRSALGVHPATGAARALGLGGWGGREEGPEGRSRILVRRLVRRGTLEVELHPDGRRLRHRRALRGLARGGCCCCEGDGALVKKDVIGAAGFCGVAFLADIVDTIERLSVRSVCHRRTWTRSVGVRACCRRRALSGCDGKQRGIYRFAFKTGLMARFKFDGNADRHS